MSPQNLIDKIAFKPYLKSSGLKKGKSGFWNNIFNKRHLLGRKKKGQLWWIFLYFRLNGYDHRVY